MLMLLPNLISWDGVQHFSGHFKLLVCHLCSQSFRYEGHSYIGYSCSLIKFRLQNDSIRLKN